jgi:hypothetical protein
MKKNQVPTTRSKAAKIQPIHTNVRTARWVPRSEGVRMPDYLAGPGGFSPLPPREATSHNRRMARETQSIEVHALGTVTFRPLGKVQMERLQEAAKRSSVSPLGDRRHKASTHEIEDAMLVTKHMLSPRFGSDQELLAALEGHDHVIGDIAPAIRDASWPNRPNG